MTTLTGNNFIAGETSQLGTTTFTSVNPRTKQPGTVEFHNATAEEIHNAVAAAAEAFAQTRTYSAARLADFLDKAAAEI
ncbi:MAG: aldehyde dehydrogenase family protein, partial [Chloroflexota bacterium]